MDDLVFATATWARTSEEESLILSNLESLSAFGKKIIVSDKAVSDFPLIQKLSKIPDIIVILGGNFDDQRHKAYLKAAKLGKNIFWIESDKKYFIENEIERILSTNISERGIIVPFPDKSIFESYPMFQREIENCLNKLVGLYIPGNNHFTYGPMVFPSNLIKYFGMTKKELGWGGNVFLAILGFAEGINLEYVKIKVSHDKDVQEGEALKRFRLEQLIDYVQSIQEASSIIEKKNG